MSQPEIAILVSSFERPRHLRRVLASIAAQRGVAGAIEVVVTDDGSRDETHRLIRQFAASANFPVRFTTHPHEGFHIARCRNEGVNIADAPYLLFLDGDCIIPPDHVRKHLDHRQDGFCLAGYPIYIDQPLAEQITEDEARSGAYLQHISTLQKLEMRWRHIRGACYSLLRSPTRPKLLGGNLGIARADYERINGYDENFRGWGCEDDDLRLRLRDAGVRVASIAWWTHTYHLWHPKTPTAPSTWKAGANVDYLHRPLRLTRCLAGVKKRRLHDLHIQIVGAPQSPSLLNRLPLWCRAAIATPHPRGEQPEIQIAFAGGGEFFSPQVDCRVLVVSPGESASRALTRHADLIFADHELSGGNHNRYPLRDFDAVMQQQLGFHSQLSRPAAFSSETARLSLPAAA
jgi:glycosyltransferase involved in cell wall biosynthesis